MAWAGRQKPTSYFSRQVWMNAVATAASIRANRRVVGSRPIGSASSRSHTALRYVAIELAAKNSAIAVCSAVRVDPVFGPTRRASS